MARQRDARNNGRSEATRAKLILAAEPIIAEHGLEKAPLRSICEAAGQRNKASIHYHFGDRAGLLQAILEYRSAMTEPARRQLLESVKEEGRAGDVKSLLRVLFGPDLAICQQEGTANYLKLMSYWFIHLRPLGALHPADLGLPNLQSLQEALHLLRQRLSFLSDERFRFRLDMCAMLVISAFIGYDAGPAHLAPSLDALSEDAFEMAAAAICAGEPS